MTTTATLPQHLLKPLSARSVALSLLLGTVGSGLSSRRLIALGEMFQISGPTMRVALSRMVAAGDLTLTDSVYALSPRHLERQQITEALIHPQQRPHAGRWQMGIVVDRGRDLRQRTDLRAAMAHHRFAELREGVWMRPDNIAGPSLDRPELRLFTTLPDDESRLCSELWDLDAWAADAHALLAALGDSTGLTAVERLTAATATVRLLRTDPVIPESLAPPRWPAEALRNAYEAYRNELSTHADL